jgi:hypothetical protein
MDDKLQQKLAEQLSRKLPAMDTVREFLQYQVWGAEPEDVERSVRGLHAVNQYRVSQIIDALEQVIAADHPPGTLSQLVMIDGNQMLMDESDDGARTWLRDLAARMRQWTGA